MNEWTKRSVLFLEFVLCLRPDSELWCVLKLVMSSVRFINKSLILLTSGLGLNLCI